MADFMSQRIVAIAFLATFLSGCIFDGAHGNAEHHWTLMVQPENGEPYVLEAPFLVPAQDTERATKGLEALRQALAAPPGSEVQWLDEPEGYLRVTAQGPVVLEAKRVFKSASIGEREAFLEWEIAGETVQAIAGGPMLVVWAMDFSGGKGHTCWAAGEYQTLVPREGSGSLEYGDRTPALCA